MQGIAFAFRKGQFVFNRTLNNFGSFSVMYQNCIHGSGLKGVSLVL